MKKMILLLFIILLISVFSPRNCISQTQSTMFLHIMTSIDQGLVPMIKDYVKKNYDFSTPENLDFDNICKQIQGFTKLYCQKANIPLISASPTTIFSFKNEDVFGYMVILKLKILDIEESVDQTGFYQLVRCRPNKPAGRLA